MECSCCKTTISIKGIASLALKGRCSCTKCQSNIMLANRPFILFLLTLMLLFVGVSSYFLVLSRLHLGINMLWNLASLIMPWVIFVLVFGILIVPAMETKIKD